MERTLRNRLTLGPIMLVILGLVLWLDHMIEVWTLGAITPGRGIAGAGIALVLMLVVIPATREIARLFTAKNVQPFRTIAILGTACLLLHAFCTQFEAFRPIAASTLAFIIVFVMLLAAFERALAKDPHESITAMAGTVLSVMYLGGLSWFLLALRVKHGQTIFKEDFIGSTSHILMILLCVKFTDIGAFFTGRAIGKHKLIPWLSPGKTWEGLIGGLVTAAIVGAICSPFVVQLIWIKGAIFGLIIGGVGQLGDLLESMMKRDAEVKDSGASVPGFGGVLDVIDSPLLAAPFAYLLFSLF
ncbi:MAG TPA: phosphatidate cytidylyltransferase [Tepidisphaeraceae bacterium]|nr:phosphatidate cytidylyltransferase [Tepidisphaeraceae bacterium]